MLTLISQADIYAPEPMGLGHVLVGGGKVLYMDSEKPTLHGLPVKEVDAQGQVLIPGLIDAHVHTTGGGGEAGFSSQAPAVPLSQFTRYGVTSVVGLLGTDDETRSTSNLIARTYALREEGLSAWCWTGGYHLPATTLTGSVRKDIVHIECVIGMGELAISDHRSSQPSLDELARTAADVHVAGLITGKAGVLHLHLGDGQRGLSMVRQLLEDTELPPRCFHPTHVNRRKALFGEACALTRQGVTIDVTAFPVAEDEDAWSAEDAWQRYQEQGYDPDKLTISSDGGGCLPEFDAQGELVHMDFATSAALPQTLSTLRQRGYGYEQILPAMTSNVAQLLRLKQKGRIKTGFDADLVLLDEGGNIVSVMANGQWMVRDSQVINEGLFENPSESK